MTTIRYVLVTKGIAVNNEQFNAVLDEFYGYSGSTVHIWTCHNAS